ncbi:MAG: tetratricopeptide repeat protein [Planctomycetaceae bacterium]|jgi:tetratricopeptide (TPR) repeat protein|nr:tetratricopeptide repeat protein [Planctomycetaceae bacterium]MBT6156165.1 tetratricopeptide repeat protein [Planctomycetaceae bacterium]MBT6484659.1 tetratricopeptide repeat protein [Planctomycetaceae bacterium]MBT6493925.1 tetratricopeptide repeat protein [Planctomycetaceae bacterium]
MNTRVLFSAAALLSVLAGCQSGPWKTALGSKFGADKSSRTQRKDSADDVQLVSGDNRNRSGRFDRRGSNDDESGPDNGDLRDVLRRGHRAEKEDQIKQAKMFYRQALDINPKEALAHHRLAIIADDENDFRTSKEHYLAALNIKRDDPNLLSDLGYSFLLQNRPDESKYYLQQALKADPTHQRALNNLGKLHGLAGDYDEALALFRQAGAEDTVQEHMAELFPNGRPRGREENPFKESSLAGSRRQPYRPEVTQASVPAPWENGGVGSRVETADGLSNRSTAHDSRNEFQRNPGQIPDERYPTRSDRNTISGRGYNENPGRLANRENEYPAGLDRPNPFASEAVQPTEQQFDSRQMPTSPADTLPVWPPANRSQSAPPRGQAVPFAPAKSLPDNSFGPSSHNSTNPFPDRQRAVSPANDQPFDARAAQGANVRQQSSGATIDRRQQAALMGLNAGPGGVFPVTHEGSGAVRQPAFPPAKRPQDVVPDFDSDPMSNSNVLDPRREFSAAPAGQLQRGFDAQRSQSTQPTDFSDDRYRTAARPVSQQRGSYNPSNGNVAAQRDDRVNNQQPTMHQFRQLLQQRSHQQKDSLPGTGQPYPQSSRQQYPQASPRQPEVPQTQYDSRQTDPRGYDSRPTTREPYPTGAAGSNQNLTRPYGNGLSQPASEFNPGNQFQQGSSSR